MTYSLRRLAREAGQRRNVTLRPIEITDALKRDLYRLTVRPVRAWEGQVKDRILPAYQRAMPGLTRDDESDDIEEAIRLSEAIIAGTTVQVTAEVENWLAQAIRWHDARWTAAISAGAGVEVYPFIDRLNSDARVKAFLRRITSLIRNIDDTARKDIAETVWRGFNTQTARKEMGKEISARLGIARRRANLIAVDQAQKLNGEITAIRMQEAGLTQYKWRHSGKVHYREHHKARNGKVFAFGQPAGDEPGFAPFCGCIRMPIIDMEDE